jgi:hypothetical protein
MKTAIQTPTESLQKVHGRGLLLSVLEEETILTGIKVFDDGRFTVETEDWSSYWQPLHKIGNKKVEKISMHFILLGVITFALDLVLF